jgi:hypothetical protein
MLGTMLLGRVSMLEHKFNPIYHATKHKPGKSAFDSGSSMFEQAGHAFTPSPPFWSPTTSEVGKMLMQESTDTPDGSVYDAGMNKMS